MTAENIENIEREREIVAHLADCPWFLTCGSLDGRWWWAHVADPAMRRDYQALMRECDEWRVRAPRVASTELLASWSLDNMIGAGATVTIGTRDGYIADQEDGPCEWDRAYGSPPPWWVDGVPAALVRRINKMTLRIARDYHAWAYGPAQREYYSHRALD